jgi:hypothetical protein
MPEDYKIMAQGNNAASGNIYTVPAGADAIIKEINIVPVTTGGTFRLNAAGKPLIPQIALGAGEWAEWEGSLAIGDGMMLYISNIVNPTGGFDYIVSGVEITP